MSVLYDTFLFVCVFGLCGFALIALFDAVSCNATYTCRCGHSKMRNCVRLDPKEQTLIEAELTRRCPCCYPSFFSLHPSDEDFSC